MPKNEHPLPASSGQVPEHQEPPELSKLFFHSFYFSQGDAKLQTLIFHYLHLLHPEWRITGETRRQLAEDMVKPMTRFLAVRRHDEVPDSSTIARTIRGELQSMQNGLCGESGVQASMEGLVWDLTRRIVERDYKYLVEEEGRPRGGDGNNAKTPMGDPFLSHAYYYGLEEHPTGVPEYDRMFHDVAHVLRRAQDEEVISGHAVAALLKDWQAVMAAYEEKHQNQAQ